MPLNKNEFRNLVRSYRKQREWTQEELAERWGYTREYVSQIEAGRKRLNSLEQVLRLADILNIPEEKAGPNKNKVNSKGYTHGFIINFADEIVFRAYAPHPAHQPVSQELQRVCSRIIDFDLLQE